MAAPMTPTKSRECPRHWVPLQGETVEVPWARDVHIERCPECKGIYLDKGEVKRLTGHAELNDLLTKHLGLDSDSPLVCPGCGMVMDAEDAGGVEVDVCLSCHGVWLDEGELARLSDTEAEAFDESQFSAEKMAELARAKRADKDAGQRAWKAFMHRLAGRDLRTRR